VILIQQGTRPTRKQKIEIKKNGLNPANWLVERTVPDKLIICNRQSNKLRELKRGG